MDVSYSTIVVVVAAVVLPLNKNADERVLSREMDVKHVQKHNGSVLLRVRRRSCPFTHPSI